MTATIASTTLPERRPWQVRFGRNPAVLYAGAAVVAVWFVIAIFADVIAPFEPNAHHLKEVLQPPNWAHWLGTDNFGRDILSRIIHGSCIDLQMGIIGVVLPFVIGTILGSIAGHFGGIVDNLLMRLLDVVLAFPWLVLLMAIISLLEPGLMSFYIAVTLVAWVSYARLVRAQVLVLKNSEFVVAARNLGYGHWRIMLRHILPNALVPSIVFSMSDVVLVILAGSAISYLGLGVQPPTAEWGVMISEGQNFIFTAWWMTMFPGLAIVFLALGFSLLADGLGEKLGVRE